MKSCLKVAHKSSLIENVFVMGKFKQSLVWQKVSALDKQINMLSETLLEDEPFGLLGQVKETVDAVVSSLDAGDSLAETGKLKYHLTIALNATLELETQLVVLSDLEIADADDISPMLEDIIEIQKLLKREIQKQS